MNPGPRHYSFDTSGLIDGLERFYPVENFPALWEKVDELIDEGRLHISEEVWNEAISVDSVVKSWCTDVSANRERCIVPTDAAIAAIAGSIAALFPKWARQGTKNNADPFVIAIAEARSCTVVSGEKPGGPGTPKIPYVCDVRQISHVRFIDVVVHEGWVFG